jgi:hypothetical protein
MTSGFDQIFAESLQTCRGKSAAFATVESLSASSSLGQLKSSEEALSALMRMKMAEALKQGERADRFS